MKKILWKENKSMRKQKYATKSMYDKKNLWTPNNISKFKMFSGPMDVAAMTQSRIKLLTKMADKHGKCSSHLFTNPKFSFLREKIVFSRTNNLFWFLTHNIWEIVCPVIMEHVCKINIFAIKMMMKSGLEKIFLNFLCKPFSVKLIYILHKGEDFGPQLQIQ